MTTTERPSAPAQLEQRVAPLVPSPINHPKLSAPRASDDGQTTHHLLLQSTLTGRCGVQAEMGHSFATKLFRRMATRSKTERNAMADQLHNLEERDASTNPTALMADTLIEPPSRPRAMIIVTVIITTGTASA